MHGLRKYFRVARLAEDTVRRTLHIPDSEAKRARDAQKFWTRPVDEKNAFWWHLRGSHLFTDDQLWQMIGKRHVDMYTEFCKTVDVQRPVKKIVDWGCGGGANAVHFAGETAELFGVDPSADALKESARQMEPIKTCKFTPVQIEIPNPESALNQIPHDIDVFFCLYVFEVFPSQEYGARILKIARELLRPGGICFVQIKYVANWLTQPRRWGYSRGVANMSPYRLDEFWTMAESCGLEPRTLKLVPKPPEVPDVNYAYYMLTKPK